MGGVDRVGGVDRSNFRRRHTILIACQLQIQNAHVVCIKYGLVSYIIRFMYGSILIGIYVYMQASDIPWNSTT